MTRRPRGAAEEKRLVEMLRAAGAPVPPGSTLHRVYASTADRTVGAWAWTVRAPDGRWLDVGSQWRRRVLLSRGIVVNRDDSCGQPVWHVDPAPLPGGQP